MGMGGACVCPTCRAQTRVVSRGLFVESADRRAVDEVDKMPVPEGELLIEALFRSISANAQDDIVRFATVFTVRCMQGHPEYLDLLRGVEDRSNYIEDSLRTRRFKIHSCLKSLTEFIQPPQAREGMQSLIQRIVATHGEAMVHWRRASDGLADRMLSVIGFEETAAAVRSCILQRDAERREDEE